MTRAPCELDKFTVEFQLACACCRVRLTARDRSEIKRLLPQVDVPAFVDLVVVRHRIGPLVHGALKQLGPTPLPAGLMEPLAAETRSNGIRVIRALRTQVLLHRWFGAAGIEWLPFKGITVAQRYYGDLGLRQVHDQDIWVPVTKLEAARDVLKAHGYRWDMEKRQWDLALRGPHHKRFLLDYYFEEQHHSDEHGFVELHWQLTGNRHQFALSPEQLLAGADRVPFGGVDMSLMNSVDTLLYLCEHGGRHNWYRLKWLADLPQLLGHGDWDWPFVFRRAARIGCLNSLVLGLALARDLFGWPVPHEVDERLEAHASLIAVQAIVREALKAPNSLWAVETLPFQWHLRFMLSSLLLSRGWRAIATSLQRRLLSPKDLRLLNLPDRWFWLYRLVRPLLLGKRLWRSQAARRLSE